VNDIFTSHAATGGIAPNLIPSPPPAMPMPWELPAAPAVKKSPFSTVQDYESIVQQLSLDRPLPLFIPNRHLYTEYQFRIINDTPQEYAVAHRRGFRPVDDPELVALFEGKISGSDKTGKLTKPVLMARDRRIGQHEMRLQRMKLDELNKGLDPKQRMFNSTKAENVLSGPDASAGKFGGMGLGRIKY
jgi:hypothetical protein